MTLVELQKRRNHARACK